MSTLLNSGELREERAEMLLEAEAITALAQQEQRDFTPDEAARFEAIMDEEDGLLAEMDAKIAATERREQQYMRLKSGVATLDEPLQPMRVPDAFRLAGSQQSAKPRMQFRNAETGEVIAGLRKDEPFYRPSGHGEPPARPGQIIHSLLTGQPQGISETQLQSAIGSSDSAGGYLISPQTAGALFLDLARNASVAMKAGAVTIPMSTSEMTIARLTGDPSPTWRGEGQSVASTDATFGRYTLRAKSLMAVIPVSVELIEDSQNASQILEDTLQKVLAQKLDEAILVGAGNSNEPQGIRNNSSCNTTAAGGALTSYAKLSEAVKEILEGHYPGDIADLSMVSNPRDEYTLQALVDGNNQFLMPPPWISQLKRYQTMAIPKTEGAGSNESTTIIGPFDQVLVGLRYAGVKVEILDSGTVTDSSSNEYNAVTANYKHVRASLRGDVCVLQPGWFSLVTGQVA